MYLTLEKGCGGRMIGQKVYVKLMSQSERVQISVYLPKEVHEVLVKWAEWSCDIVLFYPLYNFLKDWIIND